MYYAGCFTYSKCDGYILLCCPSPVIHWLLGSPQHTLFLIPSWTPFLIQWREEWVGVCMDNIAVFRPMLLPHCWCLSLWPDPMKYILHNSVYCYNLCMLICSHLHDFVLKLKVHHILGLTFLLCDQSDIFKNVDTFVNSYTATHLRNS
jgi:hypothetical protein